jgi:hypothetical protein
LKIYPEARFICLVRHCMDVIASGVRNCPWGVSRYGFDPFVAQYPDNSVAAIGVYWLSYNQAILEFCEKNPDCCTLVRYEDLVTAPEDVVADVLDFIGASPMALLLGSGRHSGLVATRGNSMHMVIYVTLASCSRI